MTNSSNSTKVFNQNNLKYSYINCLCYPSNYNFYKDRKEFIEKVHSFQLKTLNIDREVKLFEPFMVSLRELGNVFAEKIHGRSIVEFDDTGTGKYDCRCELADIAILSYSVKQKLIRLTLNQVKLAKDSFDFIDKPNFFTIQNRNQWLLLSKRCKFRPYKNRKTFDGNILHDALLTSIGSFGVFYNFEEMGYDFKYFIADLLNPDPKLKGCKLIFNGDYRKIRFLYNNTPYYKEIEGCESLSCFFCALKKGFIGSPVNPLLNDASFYKSLSELLKKARFITNELDDDSVKRKETNNRIIREVSKLIESLRKEPNGNDFDNSDLNDLSFNFSIKNLVIMSLDD